MDFYDPLYGRITIPDYCRDIVDCRYFRRLQYLRQLGLCYLAFPGGNHTRFEHSLGAFHLATLASRSIKRSRIASENEREQLVRLVCIAALCHDIGHGPFSHMSENVLSGLGASVTHEEMGAALLVGPLRPLFEVAAQSGISPEMIGHIMTKTPSGNPLVDCATALVSSELDVDRLDYLCRDAHYAGSDFPARSMFADFEDVWQLSESHGRYFFELTDGGLKFAEHVLFLRRNHYRRIVFESRHMAATAMFEKAMFEAAETHSAFGGKIRTTVGSSMDWTDAGSVQKNLERVYELYGMADYEAIDELEQSCADARYLVQRIRKSRLHRSLCQYAWRSIHHLTKQFLSTLKAGKDAFAFRRRVERFLAEAASIPAKHVAAHVPEVRFPKPLMFGVEGGGTIEDRSELGRFFQGDYLRQYCIEIFVDPQLDEITCRKIHAAVGRIFADGQAHLLES